MLYNIYFIKSYKKRKINNKKIFYEFYNSLNKCKNKACLSKQGDKKNTLPP